MLECERFPSEKCHLFVKEIGKWGVGTKDIYIR